MGRKPRAREILPTHTVSEDMFYYFLISLYQIEKEFDIYAM